MLDPGDDAGELNAGDDVGDEALDLLTIEQTMTRLKLSKSSVRRLIREGELEAVRPNRRVLVAPEAILAYKQRLREAGQAAAAAARNPAA